ncbi:MAG: beta-propeller fold lactonase family protein [Phycisphaerales bacterium]|nr:beta-propeller fold lactonase family protein [Phycisphaerales bacterium]NNM25856.1 beta-propeller fold lactonase family protein [Phycisphaerales bacterium]
MATLAIGGLAAGVRAQSQSRAVFVLNNVSDSITSFAIDEDGVPTRLATVPTSDGPIAAAIAPDGRHIAVTHGTIDDVSETLQIFSVASDATVALVLSTLVPDAPLGVRWLTSEIVAVTETDFGGNNFIRSYRFDARGRTLEPVDARNTGGFNTDLVTHPSLPLVYAQDSLGNDVRWFEFDSAGALTPRGTLSTGGIFPLRMARTNGGTMLYAAGGISGGGTNVLGLAMDAEGDLATHPGSPFMSPGDAPAYLAVSSDDRYLFVGHGGDATIGTFAIAPDGSVAPTGFVFDVGLQGTIGDIEVLGEYLMVTDESTAGDGVAGLYSFRIKDNGDLTAVDAIVDTAGVRPETIVVWDPPTPGDLDGDGDVDFLDLLALLAAWGTGSAGADLDGSGTVDFLDLLILLAAWTG